MALIIALGGTAYAAVTITGEEVKDGSLSGSDIKNGSLTTADLRNNSIRGADIRTGAVTSDEIADGSITPDDFHANAVAGLTGPKGDTGAIGPKGDTGPTGPKGDAGAPGAGSGAATTVRSTRQAIPVSCVWQGTEYVCIGRAPVTASCAAGEYATGGGYAPREARIENLPNAEYATPPQLGGGSHPEPTTGTPTGWTVTIEVTAFGTNDPPEKVQSSLVYVVCAAA